MKNPEQKQHIRRIEYEEWVYRRGVGRMLVALGSGPQRWRDIRMCITGNVIAGGCFLIGWFLPMYFAGRLESGNAEEYEHAAAHARALGLDGFVHELEVMAATELDHEVYFRGVLGNHKLLPVMRKLFGWG